MITLAYAMGGAPGGGSTLEADFDVGTFPDGSDLSAFSIFSFSALNKQKQKELKALLDNLAYGDTVMTTGGIHGKITGLADAVVTLEIADKVRIKVARSAIGAVLQKSGSSAPAATTKP